MQLSIEPSNGDVVTVNTECHTSDRILACRWCQVILSTKLDGHSGNVRDVNTLVRLKLRVEVVSLKDSKSEAHAAHSESVPT